MAERPGGGVTEAQATARRVALVTGGTRGIGRAIAGDLARDHEVAVTWRSTPPEGLPGSIFPIRADLGTGEGAETAIRAVIEAFGRLDVIVNNAGLIQPTPTAGFERATARDVLDINLLAPAALLSEALPYLEPGAAVVNISSVNAALPPRDASIYGASKAGLELWTRAMAKELGPRGIRVNAVAPGAIEIMEAPRSADLIEAFTRDTALGRIGRPEDIARAVRFLASEDAGFITGEVLTVSGGYRL